MNYDSIVGITKYYDLKNLQKQTGGMVDSDTFNRIMDDVNPENIDNELRKFYLYSACGGNRPELVKKFSGGGIDTNFCVDCYNNFLEYGDPVVSRKILKMLEKNTKLDIDDIRDDMLRHRPDSLFYL